MALVVADQGRGIPPESLPYLFRKFFREQTGDQTSEQEGDTGLGLGARFTFTLLTVEGTAGASSVGPSPASTRSSRNEQGEAGERVAVLAVDDGPQALHYIRDT